MSRFRSRMALLAVSLALGAAPPAFAAPGQLVPGFGTSGVKTQLVGTGDTWAGGVALTSDHKLITGYNLLPHSPSNWGAARFTAAGALDTTWDDPLGYTSKGIGSDGDVTATAVDHQNRAITVNSQNGSSTAFATRWDTQGFTPAGFDGDLAITGYDVVPKAIAIAPNDDVIIVGEADDGSVVNGFVARIKAAGGLDTTGFNPGGATPGVVLTPLNVNGGFGGVALQADGKIVAAGWSKGASGPENLTVARFTTAGALDSTFAASSGHAGQARFRAPNADGTEARLTSVSIDRNGNILVAGHQARVTPSATTRVAVARLTSGGVLDSSWASGSSVPGALSLAAGDGGDAQATAIVAQPSRSALLAGQARNGGKLVPFALRMKPNGEPDTGWGLSPQPNPGFAFFPFGSGDAKISGAVRDAADDTFVLAGQATIGSAPSHQEILLMRLGGQPLSAALKTGAGTSAIGFANQTVGTTSEGKTLTIFNTGELPLHVSSIAVPAGFAISDPSHCATATIGGGDTCAFTLSFAPTAAGDASGQVTVTSDAPATSVLVSGLGVAQSNLTPSTDVQVDASVTNPPAAPGDAVTITATVNSDRPIVSYLWSTEGPDLATVSVDTGTFDKLQQRIGLNDTTLWVWAVDDQGHVSDTPARIDIRVPPNVCLNNQTTGDLTLGFVHIKSSECIRTNTGGNDFVVPLGGGGASINGLEVRCPTTGTCGNITIKHTDASSTPLQPGDKRAFALRSTTPVDLLWVNGQNGSANLGDHVLSVDMPNVTQFALARAHRPVAKAARDLNLSYTSTPPPPITVPRPEFQIASFDIPTDTFIGTLPTNGKATLTIFGTTYQYCTGCSKPFAVAGPGIKLTTNVLVDVPGSSTPVSGPLSQEANSQTGPESSGGDWEVDLGGVGFFPLFHFDDLVLRYTPFVPADEENGVPARSGVFEFEATIGIDITGWTVEAAGTFSKTYGFESVEFGFHRQAGQGFTGLNVPLGRRSATGLPTRAIPVQLQDLDGNFQLHPYLSVGGNVIVILAEEHLIGGGFQYSEAHEKVPWSFLATVTFPIEAVDVTGTFYVQGSPAPGAGISGGVGFTVKDVIYITGTVWAYFGFDEATKEVQAEFGLRGSVTVFNYPLAGFIAFINNNVVAGCGNLGDNIKGWAVYKWESKESDFGFGGCDNIEEYSLVPGLAGFRSVGAHASAVKLRVPAGVDWANLELRSADGVAQAKIEGPGGVSFTSPDKAGLTGGQGDKTMALADSTAHRTVIGIHAPKPGVYTVTSIDGAPKIVDAHIAYGKPTKVKARLTGKGAKRVLHYTVTGPKADVAFEERAAKVDNTVVQRLGSAKGAKGTIPFRTADLGPTKHIIVARVTKNGQELPVETVARFTASPVKPAKPKRLRIKVNRLKAFATVTWAKDRIATRYDVKLRTTSGRRIDLSVKKPKFTVPSVYVGDKITVTVRGIAPFQRKGPSKTVSVKITQPKKKKAKKKKS